jgi:NarL family two-component system sensor histidine kinase YdfH
MGTIGSYLIVAAVSIRSLLQLEGLPNQGRILMLLIPYTILLVAEPLLTARLRHRYAWYAPLYLLIQVLLVRELLLVPPHQDTFLALFIPLALQAVQLFGQRIGFICIAVFPVATIAFLIDEPETGNFIMVIAFEAMCFLAGGYAHLIQATEAANRENQRMAGELENAHQQLQAYTEQTVALAAERERFRLARDMHDSVTQTVFSMNLTAQTARLLMEKDASRVNAQLERLVELGQSALQEIHQLVAKLKPKPAEAIGLIERLNQLFSERYKLYHLDVDFVSYGSRNLDEAVANGLVRIVQEALTNVIKHSGTNQASVCLDLDSVPAFVEIEDKGIGFEVEAIPNQRGHLGLAAMAEQASEIGWQLSFQAQKGQGTKVRIEEARRNDNG